MSAKGARGDFRALRQLHGQEQPVSLASSDMEYAVPPVAIRRVASKAVEWARNAPRHLDHMRVDHRRLQTAMAEQKLYRPDVGS